MLSLELPLINKALNHYFGRFLLQAGPLFSLSPPIKNIGEVVSIGGKKSHADIVCQEHAWPILTEGVECIVLHHSLDFSCSPHDMLREAARCIRPGGHLLIIGFNPFSAWGIYRRFTTTVLSDSHSLTYARLADWLKLLGFSVEQRWIGGYSWPRSNILNSKAMKFESIAQQRKWLGNGFYIISARKLMIQPTPLENKRLNILKGMAPIPVVNRSDLKANE